MLAFCALFLVKLAHFNHVKPLNIFFLFASIHLLVPITFQRSKQCEFDAAVRSDVFIHINLYALNSNHIVLVLCKIDFFALFATLLKNLGSQRRMMWFLLWHFNKAFGHFSFAPNESPLHLIMIGLVSFTQVFCNSVFFDIRPHRSINCHTQTVFKQQQQQKHMLETSSNCSYQSVKHNICWLNEYLMSFIHEFVCSFFFDTNCIAN